VTRALQEAPLDGPIRLQRLAELVVPDLADWCAAFSKLDDGSLALLGIGHADPELVAWAHERYRDHPLDPNLDLGVSKVVRTGQAELATSIDDEQLRVFGVTPERVDALRGLGLKSVMVVPIKIRAHVFGAVAFASTRADRIYGDEDLALAREIGERAGQAMENARLYQESQQSVRTREDLLAFASHDLRNPLGTLTLAVEVLARGLPPEEERKRKAAANVRRSIDRMERLISDLLDLARLEGAGIVLERRPVEAGALVAEALDAMGPLAADRHVRLENAMAAAGAVYCDRERALQALVNLIDNALKFSPEGAAVRVGAELAGEGEMRLYVLDDGPGIAEEERARIFQRFVQADRRDSRGVGLGLAIAQGLVEAHGGTIGVESAPGQGSKFWFTLPIA
jgi:signal transduction histidine kinase